MTTEHPEDVVENAPGFIEVDDEPVDPDHAEYDDTQEGADGDDDIPDTDEG